MTIQHNSGLGRDQQSVGYGRRESNAPNNVGYGGQPTTYNGAAKLINQIVMNSRSLNPHGQMGDPNEGFKGFSYNKGKTEGHFGGMFDNTQVLNDEQYRIDAVDQAAQQAALLYGVLHNRMGAYFNATKEAMEMFKRDVNGIIQPCFEAFIIEVENNLQLYRYMASNTCALFACDLVNLVMSSSLGDLNNDIKKQLSLIRSNFLDIICLEYMSWLEGNPNGLGIIQSMTPMNKMVIEKIDNMLVEGVQNKFLTISVGSTNFPFPWKKGTIKRMLERTQIKSTILEDYDFHPDAKSHGSLANYIAPMDIARSSHNDAYQTLQILANKNTNNVHVIPGNETNAFYDVSNSVFHDEWGNEVDKKTYYIKKITPYNRKEYRIADYFIRIENAETEMYVVDPEHFRYISAVLTLRSQDGDKPPYFRALYKIKNCVPVVKIDWDEGVYDYTNISLGDISLNVILTDPNKVLPLLSSTPEKDALNSYEEYIKETSFITNDKNEPVSIPECKKLTKDPKILFGASPLEVDTNEDVIHTMTVLSDRYDPNEKLDAFIIPYRTHKIFQMEKNNDFEMVYKNFPDLITGKCNAETMTDFVNKIRTGLALIDSVEISNLIRYHITNVVNRWLVECRFYAEKKEDKGYLKFDDLLDDHEKFLAFVKEKDPTTAAAYFNLTKNDFLRENFTLFSSKHTREKYIKKQLEKFKDDLLIVKTSLYQSAVLIEREFILAKINPMKPLNGYEQVILPKSGYPALDWVFKESLTRLEKHFDRHVPFLMTFKNDSNGRIWVASKSEFDNGVYSLRPISMTSNIQLLNIAK